MAEKLLSIVTGCYNEVENIPLFYERCLNVLKDYADEYDYEFIVADNCSTDGTRDVLREIAKRDKKFRVIMNSGNFGHIRSPFNAFLSARGDAVLYICSDLQEPPEMLREFIRKEDIVEIETAREALKDIALQDEETIDATKIVEIVCKFYGVKKEELLARKRTKNIAEARQIAMYLITEYLNIPLESVGNIFGKDHSTVIYAKNKVAEDIKKSKKLEVQINDLKQMIEGK